MHTQSWLSVSAAPAEKHICWQALSTPLNKPGSLMSAYCELANTFTHTHTQIKEWDQSSILQATNSGGWIGLLSSRDIHIAFLSGRLYEVLLQVTVPEH